MLAQYLPILILAVVAVGLGLVFLAISHFIGPRDPSPIKDSTYESGMTPIGPGRRQVPIRFYLVATLFILFDIEVVYLYPWAVKFKDLALPAPAGLGWGALWSMAAFLIVLVVGFVHVWKRGALEWD